MASPDEIGAGIGGLVAAMAATFAVAKKVFSGKWSHDEDEKPLTEQRHSELCELATTRLSTSIRDELRDIFKDRDRWLTEMFNEHQSVILKAIKENGNKKP
jgi:hypothetical protein